MAKRHELEIRSSSQVSQGVRDDFPHLEPFWPFLDYLNQESDRGKALVSSGFLEQQLKDVILAFLLEKKEARELLDGQAAPLTTFASRIDMAYVLGLISEDEHHNLSLVRKIRNDFAHTLQVDFSTQKVKDRCAALRMKLQNASPQGQFQLAVVALIMSLIVRPKYVARQRRTSRKWPRPRERASVS
ncbi:MAG: transcriptional regulator [Methyloceanibacter sp.]|uniref:transcriptional regulator n=1 Tax=Methyloceanibacter sp. TaxID=1965321 RepID=UPI003D9AE896